MKVIDLAQNTSHNLFEKVAGYFNLSGTSEQFYPGKLNFHIEPKRDNGSGHELTVRSVASYLFDALSEGVKQNFLGPNIDMEFFTLTIRVYLIRFARLTVSYPKYNLEDQYSEKRNSMSNISNDDRSIISLKLSA